MPHGWIGKPSMPAALAAPADSFDLFSPARPLASPPFKSETDHASQGRLVNRMQSELSVREAPCPGSFQFPRLTELIRSPAILADPRE